MRRILIIVSAALLVVGCNKQSSRIDRAEEDGIEVIRNKWQPYLAGHTPRNVKVRKNILIDFGGEEIARLGIADIRDFDIDADRNIYISAYQGDYCIYKFAPDGSFISAFARKGEGPGEMVIAKSLYVNQRGEVIAFESRKRKLLFFDSRGKFLREVSCPLHSNSVRPLTNGNFLISATTPQLGGPLYYWVNLSLYDSVLREIKQLEHIKIPNGPGTSFWVSSKIRLFVSSEGGGYEIRVYSLDGVLIRKIKKEYRSVKIPDDIRLEWKQAIERMRQDWRGKEEFMVPEYWPPFQAFFIDDKGYLFVRTYEEGPAKGEYVHDIFDQRGIFVGRQSFDLTFRRERRYAKAENGKVYGFCEGPSGFERFIVYETNLE